MMRNQNGQQRCAVPVISVVTGEVVLELILYGVTMQQLCTVFFADKNGCVPPEAHYSGGRLVRAALRRRGLNPDQFTSSPLLCYELGEYERPRR